MTTSNGANVNVVTKYCDIRSGDRERNLCKSRIERLNVNDGILLVRQTEGAKKAFDFNFSIGRFFSPETDGPRIRRCAFDVDEEGIVAARVAAAVSGVGGRAGAGKPIKIFVS